MSGPTSADPVPGFVFIVPLRNPAIAADWERCVRLCEETLRSAANQGIEPERLHVILACKEFPEGDRHPSIEILRHRFPDPEPNWEAQHHDKYAKIKLALVHARKHAPCYVMKLDADDLVSNKLAEYVLEEDNRVGYYLESGYRWQEGEQHLNPEVEFHRSCGSSNVLFVSSDELPPSMAAPSEDYDLLSLGHNIAVDALANRGTPLEPIPFPAAVYRVGTGENITSLYRPKGRGPEVSPNWKYHLGRVLAAQRRRIRRVRISAEIAGEFGIGSGRSTSGGERRVGFIVVADDPLSLPSTRLSVCNHMEGLRKHGYESEILIRSQPQHVTGHPATRPDLDAIPDLVAEKGYRKGDIVYFQKVWGDSALRCIESLRERGIACIFGICDLVVPEMTAACDCTIVVSEALREQHPEGLRSKVEVVEDGIEFPEVTKQDYSAKGLIKHVILTSAGLTFEPSLPPLPSGHALTVIGYFPLRDRLRRLMGGGVRGYRARRWKLRAFAKDVIAHDVALIPIPLPKDPLQRNYLAAKSANRLSQLMALGMPVICSAHPAYSKIAEGGNCIVAETEEEWSEAMRRMESKDLREQMGRAARLQVIDRYGYPALTAKLAGILDSTRADMQTEAKR